MAGRNCTSVEEKERRKAVRREKARIRAAAWRIANPKTPRPPRAPRTADERRAADRVRAMRWLAKEGSRAKVAARAAAARLRPEERERRMLNEQNRRKRAGGAKLSRGITAKLMALQCGLCAGCGCDLKQSGHHLDHIMPLALSGPHEDSNIQLLCPPCNRLKNAKHPADWARENGRLL